jgi:hypothetical protein
MIRPISLRVRDLRQRAGRAAVNLPLEATHNATDIGGNIAPDLVPRDSTRDTGAHYDSAVRPNLEAYAP